MGLGAAAECSVNSRKSAAICMQRCEPPWGPCAARWRRRQECAACHRGVHNEPSDRSAGASVIINKRHQLARAQVGGSAVARCAPCHLQQLALPMRASACSPIAVVKPHCAPERRCRRCRRRPAPHPSTASPELHSRMAAPITGKTVVVVGGSRGIGAELVRQFAAKGNRVLAGCRCGAAGCQAAGLHLHGCRCHAAPPRSPSRVHCQCNVATLLRQPSTARSPPAFRCVCRKLAEAREVQGLENVSLTTIDVQSPQSVAAWAEEVAGLAPHVDVRAHAGLFIHAAQCWLRELAACTAARQEHFTHRSPGTMHQLSCSSGRPHPATPAAPLPLGCPLTPAAALPTGGRRCW